MHYLIRCKVYLLKIKLKRLKDLLFPFIFVKYNSDKWIYVSYLTEPFRRKDDLMFMNGHQNRRETLILSDILNDLNFSYRITDHNYFKKKNKRYDFVFGIEPGFEKISLINKSAVKIYYATGAHYTHQNKVIIDRTEYFKNKWNVNYPYYRLVKEHESCELADYIIQIGSIFTVETYPSHLRSKVKLINQSTPEIYNFNIEEKVKNTFIDNYIWLGGGGSILKGLDLVLDFFLENNKLILHVVGDIDFELMNLYKDKISLANNIFLYGFLDISSEVFFNIVYRCCFIIYPSSSEGGASGSVLTLQKYGLIPIVSKYASVNEIKILGFQMQNIDNEWVEKGIEWSLKLKKDEIEDLMIKNHYYITANFNLENFKKEMNSVLSKILNQ
jgi:hypothetical protein